jgi:outer membrane protein assembly factor BamA
MKRLFAMTMVQLFAFSALAQTQGTSQTSMKEASARESNRYGATISLGQPYPQILGINASYNITDRLRANLGWGETSVTTSASFSAEGITTKTSTLSTIGLGAEYFFTDWSFRPVTGLSVSQNQYTGGEGLSVNGVDKSGTILVGSAGFDWQGQGGAKFGIGMQSSLSGGSGGGLYVNGGYFF